MRAKTTALVEYDRLVAEREAAASAVEQAATEERIARRNVPRAVGALAEYERDVAALRREPDGAEDARLREAIKDAMRTSMPEQTQNSGLEWRDLTAAARLEGYRTRLTGAEQAVREYARGHLPELLAEVEPQAQEVRAAVAEAGAAHRQAADRWEQVRMRVLRVVRDADRADLAPKQLPPVPVTDALPLPEAGEG